jgi:hypothetical protein
MLVLTNYISTYILMLVHEIADIDLRVGVHWRSQQGPEFEEDIKNLALTAILWEVVDPLVLRTVGGRGFSFTLARNSYGYIEISIVPCDLLPPKDCASLQNRMTSRTDPQATLGSTLRT